MPQGQSIASQPVFNSIGLALMACLKEIAYVLSFIVYPRRVIEEMQEMLMRRADEIEASDPDHARALREHARRLLSN